MYEADNSTALMNIENETGPHCSEVFLPHIKCSNCHLIIMTISFSCVDW